MLDERFAEVPMKAEFNNVKSKVAVLILLMFTVNMSTNASVKSDYKRITDTIDWIYSPKHKRRPTGNMASFTGNQLLFWYNTKRKINGADVSFGYTLYRTYDMYCMKRSKRKNCLGKKLSVNYTIKGQTKSSALLSVSVNGKKFSTNYFQEAIAKFYELLESKGGYTKLSSYEKNLIKPPRKIAARVRLKVISPDKTKNKANNKWLSGPYVGKVFSSLKSSLFNMVDFSVKERSKYVSDYYFNHKKQKKSLKKFKSYRKSGHISAVITGPNTNDAAGMAYVTKSSQPTFVMRSRYNYGNSVWKNYAIKNTALIFLHELGHNMLKLDHCKKGQSSLCTDNIHTSKDRASQVVKRMSSIGLLEARYDF